MAVLTDDGLGLSSSSEDAGGGGSGKQTMLGRGGTNVAVTGNRIDIKVWDHILVLFLWKCLYNFHCYMSPFNEIH